MGGQPSGLMIHSFSCNVFGRLKKSLNLLLEPAATVQAAATVRVTMWGHSMGPLWSLLALALTEDSEFTGLLHDPQRTFWDELEQKRWIMQPTDL